MSTHSAAGCLVVRSGVRGPLSRGSKVIVVKEHPRQARHLPDLAGYRTTQLVVVQQQLLGGVQGADGRGNCAGERPA